MTKLRVGLLFGGRSGEHEVSISSARAIAKALSAEQNADKYEILPFYIQKDGNWLAGEAPQKVLLSGVPLLESQELTSEGQHLTTLLASGNLLPKSPKWIFGFPFSTDPTVKTVQFRGYSP